MEKKIYLLILLLLLPRSVTGQSVDPERLFDDEGLPVVVVGPTEVRRDPIAVPNVRCDGSAKICSEITEQLRHNLGISTYFEVVNPKRYAANKATETLAQTEWSDWSQVGARYLIKGKVSGAGPYSIELRFYNVLDKANRPIDGQSHSKVVKKDIHAAVDTFINGTIGQLTGTPGVFGSKIVFSAKTGLQTRGIGMMEMDGHGRAIIAGGNTINHFPHFAPGGDISYTSFRHGKPDIWVGEKKLTNDPWHYRGASWSKTGRLAASLSKGAGSHIYLLNQRGKIIRRLTDGASQNVSPSWSPDGSQIAFVSDRGGGPQIYIVGVGGGAVRRVTMAGGYNSTPDWGPNGLIAFTAGAGRGYDIFTVTPEGGMTRVTQGQGSNKDPCWSPDGRVIAFVSKRAGYGTRIWVTSADGRWQFPISEEGRFSTLKWSR